LIIGAYHFAESEKSANRENSPWFRGISSEITAGRRKKFRLTAEVTKR